MNNENAVDVVAALIWQNDRFLICKRPEHKKRGLLWEFVGGKVEAGETMEDALIRECKEELDITVAPFDIFMQLVHEYPDIKIRLTVFNAAISSGTPKLLEHCDMKWILPSQIQAFEFCPADKDIIEKIIQTHR